MKQITLFLALSSLITTPFVNHNNARAQGVEQLLLERVPVPLQRPQIQKTAPSQNTDREKAASDESLHTGAIVAATTAAPKTTTIRGSLKDGLKAISDKNGAKARAILQGLPTASLDAKILRWSMAVSAPDGTTSGEIAGAMELLSSWPAQKTMRRNLERAIAREASDPNAIIRSFGGTRPESVEGGTALAAAYLAIGNQTAANAAIAPFWRNDKLSKSTEETVLKKAGQALNRSDHRFRMHRMFYRERSRAANRVARFAEQSSLAKARTALVRKSGKAGKLLKSVAASSKRDPGYIFAQAKWARRTENYKEAARLLLKAPKSESALVYPDEWWVEARITSRALIDRGDAKTAYKLAANHRASSPAKQAEAEFHAGWYALRFLRQPRVARKHFEKILRISKRPISQARGYYWLGRASGSAGRKYFQEAAKHTGTFYGQLASAKLGRRNLQVRNPRPSAAERSRFGSRELVKAIIRLEDAGYGWRADTIYRHLSKNLDSPGEIALLSARAEKKGNQPLALQIGKLAYGRGLPVDTVSWPIGAIPRSAKIGTTGKAMAYAIARQESAFNKAAVSPANARGLLQLLPATAKRMARKKGMSYSFKRLTRDAGYNATLGAAYLSSQLDNFNNSYILMAVGYNAGPGRARDWVEKYGDPRGKPIEEVVDWVERIPFTETRNYVQRIMENYQIYKARLGKPRLTIVEDLRFGRR